MMEKKLNFFLLIMSICGWKNSRALLRINFALDHRRFHYYKQSSSSSDDGLLLFTRRYCSSSTTQYTIDEEGVDPDVLERTVLKHCNNLSRFMKEKPIAAHTREAFMVLRNELLEKQQGTIGTAPIIFDSGCGTGKSTLLLGRAFPNHTIIGIDRSLSRLTKNGVYRDQQQEQQSSSKDDYGDSSIIGDENNNNNNNNNVFLIRAELADFWRLWLEEASSTTTTTETRLSLPEKHFLLYPNPYPKRRRYQNRWYCHPSFPLLRKLASEEIVVRSNWKEYLQDFATAVEIANNNQEEEEVQYTPNDITQVDSSQLAWTNFEQKYFDVGENCYELRVLKNKKKE